MFETGANQWKSYASWPPPGAQSRTLYLQAERQPVVHAAGQRLPRTRPTAS